MGFHQVCTVFTTIREEKPICQCQNTYLCDSCLLAGTGSFEIPVLSLLVHGEPRILKVSDTTRPMSKVRLQGDGEARGEARMHSIQLHNSSGWRIRLRTKTLLSQPEKQILSVFTKLISLARETLKATSPLAPDPNEDYGILQNLRSIAGKMKLCHLPLIQNVVSLFAENV